MKVAIILGRGIEGCGNTKRAIMLHNYNLKNKIESKIFCNNLQWPRRESFNFEYNKFDINNINSLQYINTQIFNYDYIVHLSLPPVRKYSRQAIENYQKYIIELSLAKKIYIQTDHNILSIRRNELLNEMCENANFIFCHSNNNPFANLMKKYSNKMLELTPTIDFEEHKKLYWKSIENVDLKHIKFISRSAKWKGHFLFYELFKELKSINNSFLFTAEGMEMSLAGLKLYFENGERDDGLFPFLTQYHDSPRFSSYNETKIDKNKITIFGPYKHNECMERLSKCGFGFELYNLNEKWYGKSIESCMLEIICSGCIPIFHKHFGINTKYYNINYTDFENFENTGTIFLDEHNVKYVANLINNISKDSKAIDYYRNISFNYWKQFVDINKVFENFYKIISVNKNE